MREKKRFFRHRTPDGIIIPEVIRKEIIKLRY